MQSFSIMSNENLSAMLYGKKDLRLVRRPVEAPSDGEVLVRIHSCGICGTDIHMWSTGEGGHELPITDPIVIGHECSGVVVAASDDVQHPKIGDRVALELGLPCRRCDLCKRGKYNLCKPFSLGGLAQYHSYAADFCHVLPDNVSSEAGAMIEPLAVAVHACRRANVSTGQRILICGAGTIGLCCLLTARALGVSEVCITDVSPFRLQLASKLGATYTIRVEKELTTNEQDLDKGARRLADMIVERMKGRRPDRSIECSGAPASLRAAIYATKSGGVMTPVALDPAEARLPMLDAATREVDIRGSFSYCGYDYPAAISMVSSGKVDPTPIITTRYKQLDDVTEAFQLASQSEEGVIKVMITCD